MKKIRHLIVALLSFCAILTSCSQDEKTVEALHDGQYQVTIISNSLTRGITDVVQGAGRYPEGETVTLFTNTQKFKASAKGSTDGDWNQVKEDVRAVLTSRINQDWTVTIKYYCDVTFINTAPGGDGTTKTVSLEVGTPLPAPVTNSGYTFEGWYDGETKVDKVPDSSNRTMTAKFKKKAPEPSGPFDILINPFASNSTEYSYSANDNFGIGSNPVFSFMEGTHVRLLAYDGDREVGSYEFMMPAHGLVFGFDDRVPAFIYVESMR